MKRLLAKHSPLVILAGLCVVFAVISESFRDPGNLTELALRTSVIAIIATGQTLVILIAGIDLSVGSVAALSGIVCVLTMNAMGGNDMPLAVATGMVAGVAVGSLCGFINGTLTAKGKIPAFIVTLGMMMAARGITLLMSGGGRISPLLSLKSFAYLGGSQGWWIPVSISVAITAIFAVILGATRFGRAIYATGGNKTGARLSGIRVDRVQIGAFTLCGMLTGFGGVMLASYTTVADAVAGEGYELDAIASCVIGGASLMGGEGGCIGAFAGALITKVLVNFCNLNDIDVYWQKVLVGVLIVGLVFYDTYRKRKSGMLRD